MERTDKLMVILSEGFFKMLWGEAYQPPEICPECGEEKIIYMKYPGSSALVCFNCDLNDIEQKDIMDSAMADEYVEREAE